MAHTISEIKTQNVTGNQFARLEGISEAYTDAMGCFERGIKRLVDIVAALCGIVILFPLMLLIYILVLFSGGNVIYRQRRVGLGGKDFTIYKFRTMRKDAEKNGILRTEDERRSQMTKLGRFLCEHHLDELPQIVNVLIGDMSLVGPRPERRVFVEQILKVNPNYVYMYKMRPGLTSKAALYNGYTDTMEKMLIRLDMDLEYFTTRSLWSDFVLVVKTVSYLISGKKF